MNTKYSFNQGWEFVRGASSKDAASCWESVTLPHTVRLEPVYQQETRTYQGVCLYRKRFPVKESLKGQKFFLKFEAVMGVTDVWLNGTHLTTAFGRETPDPDGTIHTNACGYLPFVVELDPYLRWGAENELLLQTDNQDNGQVPPGKPQELLDFTYFGGIYRNTWLTVCDPLHITDELFENRIAGGGIFVHMEEVSRERALLLVDTHIRNERPHMAEFSLHTILLDPDGRTAAEERKNLSLNAGEDMVENVGLSVTAPKLWNLDTPWLYMLAAELKEGDTIIYRKKQRIGIRSITADRVNGLRINGERAPLLSGVNRHQDYPLIGNAAPSSMQRRDAVLFKEAGFSVVRAAHYPMSEEFLDACDELGILVFESTPGWQWYPSEDIVFTKRVHQNIRQMVRRDRNHPSVLAYEVVLNETYHVPYGYNRMLETVALEEDGQAKVSAESYGYDASEEANGIDKLADFIYGFEQPLEKTEKAVMFLREYTDLWMEAYGDFQSRRVTRGKTKGIYPGGEARNVKKARKMLCEKSEDGYSLADCQRMYDESPAFVGCAIWTGIDSCGFGSDISACGVWDTWRLPKYAFYAYQSQCAPENGGYRLFTASRWTKHAPFLDKGEGALGTDELREVDVYSNCASAELQVLRGEEVLYRKTEQPIESPIPYPPFHFREVPYTSGTTLRVKGFDENGTEVIRQNILPEEEPVRIELEAATHDIPVTADGSDLVMVYARALDRNGTLCENYEGSIYFTAEGGEIIGTEDCRAQANPVTAEAGIAAVYFRPERDGEKLVVHAVVAEIGEACLEIPAEKSKKIEFPFVAPGERLRSAAAPSMISKEQSLREEGSSIATGNLLVAPANISISNSYNLESKLVSGIQVETGLLQPDSDMYAPHSIALSENAVFRLDEKASRLFFNLHLEGNATLLAYEDGVLRAEFARDGEQVLEVEHCEELKLVVTGGKAFLWSPYLIDEPCPRKEDPIHVNLLMKDGVTACANVHSEKAAGLLKREGRTWEHNWMGTPLADGENQWWQADLGTPHAVRNAMIHVGGQMGADCTAYTYEIQTSADGTLWKTQTVTKRTAWSNGVLDCFKEQNVRYLRVVFTRIDGRMSAALTKVEIYEDFGVDSSQEINLKGIIVEGTEQRLVFDPYQTEYTLPVPNGTELKITAIPADPKAHVTVDGEESPVIVLADADAPICICVRSANGCGEKKYWIMTMTK